MIQYYISPNGCDANPGNREAPFATFDAARLAVQQHKGEAATVTVLAGSYRIDTLRFTEADSGSPECPVTYEAEGTVLLIGGLPLSADDFEPLTTEEKKRLHGDAVEKVVKADLKKYGLTRRDWGEICAIGSHGSANKYDGAVTSPMWCELFVNDTRMEIARYPDEGFLYTEDVIREGKCKEPTGQARLTDAEWRALRNPIGDIRRIDADTAERVKNWKSFDDVWTYGYPKYNWADESTPITALDPVERTMETTYVSIFGAREHAPYYFFNVLEELDVPGEWYLDRENGILYLYPPTDLYTADICLSLSAVPLLKLENVTDVTFRGFTFMATRSDAMEIAGSRITIDGCEIKNVAGWAVSVNGNACTVKNCSIHHTGQGGIRINGGDRMNLTSSENRILNNHIHHIAEIYRTYRPGVSISGVNCLVAHNCIHDSAHMAISFSGNEHIIEYNEIHSVCKIADDSSAIYAGRDYTTCGNVIRYNYFHDMSSDAAAQH
ncbi:MAG: right-handed parallel beta-helix repeat-containing protein, partial [Clostridia bacterium]|nr:right-handed parallel beta-helix repeat-containing protein [Clostridia bacterium]